MTGSLVLRHRRTIAYVSLIAACYLAWSLFSTWLTLAYFWVNAWPRAVLLVIAIAVHLKARAGAEIPGLARATKVGIGCVAALVALTIAFFLMTGPMG